jgi:hypothetical protein
LLTLYTSNDNFKYNLTHQPKIYSITNSGYSTDPINEDYFENIETWLNKNSNSGNNLTIFFNYRGNNKNPNYINNEDIQSYIFGTSDEYNLAPIKITAIETLTNSTEIDVNTLATIYKYLLSINDVSGNLQIMLESLKGKITSLSDGLTADSDTSYIEKSLMN